MWKNKCHTSWWNHPGLEGCLVVFTSHLLLMSYSVLLIFGYCVLKPERGSHMQSQAMVERRILGYFLYSILLFLLRWSCPNENDAPGNWIDERWYIVVHSLSCVRLFVALWTATRQASLSFSVYDIFVNVRKWSKTVIFSTLVPSDTICEIPLEMYFIFSLMSLIWVKMCLKRHQVCWCTSQFNPSKMW